ncbi:MAG: hypothetical protein OIF58_08825 [Cohaesibacter sp.]|nr:hypothetical protein [Cohaesibacter sp.]
MIRFLANLGFFCLIFVFLGSFAQASERYVIGDLVQGDEVFACRTESLALKIQKSGLAPENLGAAIENNDCFFLDRFDHVPVRLVLRANDLSVFEVDAKGRNVRLGTLFVVIP